MLFCWLHFLGKISFASAGFEPLQQHITCTQHWRYCEYLQLNDCESADLEVCFPSTYKGQSLPFHPILHTTMWHKKCSGGQKYLLLFMPFIKNNHTIESVTLVTWYHKICLQETLFLFCLSHKDKCKNSYMHIFAHTCVSQQTGKKLNL